MGLVTFVLVLDFTRIKLEKYNIHWDYKSLIKTGTDCKSVPVVRPYLYPV